MFSVISLLHFNDVYSFLFLLLFLLRVTTALTYNFYYIYLFLYILTKCSYSDLLNFFSDIYSIHKVYSIDLYYSTYTLIFMQYF